LHSFTALVGAEVQCVGMPTSAQLRLTLSDLVSVKDLVALHRGTEGVLPALFETLRSTGYKSLTPVYNLTDLEITQDKYGFARDFTIVLMDEALVEEAIKKLSSSGFVKKVRSPVLRRSR